MQYTATYQSPIGRITMASDGQNLSGLWFDGQKYFADTLSTEHEFKDLLIFEQTKRWLDLYFQGNVPDFTPSLYLKSSPFRLAVWDILKQIPYGKIITYGEIADLIAKKQGVKTMSAQAVGGAVGHNPISIIIPCHRVIGSNGSLTGYAGGLDKKISLLTIEKVDVRKFFIPKKRTAL
ncbi:methylated-DNA--[protein]-cysteine S-methyltransferase [Solibaculum mannosilyticum]|uniref:Methylated-DNA--protein-cysteine methyltransferase n=1 Tax=Solibaculum mannosilyticum TaxID=2780922 RepID=A0A7I8D1G6_9FIRM|nr:methylated-DNA--[protein]-cysteine S-methyltransferase [Solibaculum mannosilyticum]BCI60586.1 methylated-DNA--protein-cysteine methyltransferase [Solibaculum mannosilyticum]